MTRKAPEKKQEHHMWLPTNGCRVFDKGTKCLSQKRDIILEKKHFELSPFIVNVYSKFQVTIFSNYRGITKCQGLAQCRHWKRRKQFILFTQCFQKAYTADTSKQGLVWESVK